MKRKWFRKTNITNKEHINRNVFTKLVNDIYIWRKKEILKATIHELLHGLHGCINRYPKLINVSIKYNISKEININETYTNISKLLKCLITYLSNKCLSIFHNVTRSRTIFTIKQIH